MLTDIYSIPQLLTILVRSELNEHEIEYQILEKISHEQDHVLKRKRSKKAEVSVTIPYNGATIGFVISVLGCFGLS